MPRVACVPAGAYTTTLHARRPQSHSTRQQIRNKKKKLEISTSVIGSDALIVAHLETVEDPGNVVMMLPITYIKDMCALVVWQRINELT